MYTRTSYAAELYIDIEAYGIWGDGWNRSRLWPIILNEIHDEAIVEYNVRHVEAWYALHPAPESPLVPNNNNAKGVLNEHH